MTKIHRPDPITNPTALGTEADPIWHTLRPLDRVAREMEQRWGINRLPSLVPAETAARFGRVKVSLDVAIIEGNAKAVEEKAGALIRGWRAMNKIAAEAGHKPIRAKAWVHDGIAVCPSSAAASAYVVEHGNNPRVYSIEEVVRIIRAWESKNTIATQAKDLFPGAEVKRIEQSDLDDEIPF